MPHFVSEIKIDEDCTETKIVVVTSKVTEEVNEIVKRLSSEQPQMIAGFKDEQATMLEPNQIYRVYASEGKGFDLSFVGTICVSLSNGTVTYVSRRHVSKIKQLLGL